MGQWKVVLLQNYIVGDKKEALYMAVTATSSIWKR